MRCGPSPPECSRIEFVRMLRFAWFAGGLPKISHGRGNRQPIHLNAVGKIVVGWRGKFEDLQVKEARLPGPAVQRNVISRSTPNAADPKSRTGSRRAGWVRSKRQKVGQRVSS